MGIKGKGQIKNREALAKPHSKQQEEKDARSIWILKELTSGKSRSTVRKMIQDKYNCNLTTANNYMNTAYVYLGKTNEQYIEKIREIQLRRIENIYERAMADNDLKTALNAIDLMNKTFALYEIKAKVEVENNVIHFKFGDNNFTTTSNKNNDNAYFKDVDRGFTDAEIVDE